MASLIIYAKLDFLDVHVYPSVAGDMNAFLNRDLVQADERNTVRQYMSTTPVLMGEFGAYQSVFSNNFVAGAVAMKDIQISSCVSYGFQGWLLWTWDCDECPGGLWTMTGNGGAINGVLSPAVRSSPCQ